jgi:hypothetical protein
MKNFTHYSKAFFFAALLTTLNFGAQAQVPAAIGTDISGTYVDTNLVQYGLFGQYRTSAPASIATGGSKVEFPIAVGDYSTVWRAYAGGQILLGYNQIIDTTQTASALYNNSYGGSGILLPAVTSGYFYTFNIQNHTSGNTSNDTMAVLETTYNPVSVTAVSIPVDTNTIGPACSPLITATLSATPSVGEYVYLRYSLNSFTASSIVIPMNVSGTSATATLPPYPAGTHVEYYVLTSPLASLISTGPGSAYYDCLTLSLKNGGPSSNFRYTVKTLAVPSVSITISSNPVCQGSAATFTAHGVDNGTVASDYQWYKNNVAVGTDDSIYVDATLNNHDSVYVIMTANLGCPVMDTSSSIIVSILPVPVYSQSATICPGQTFTVGTNIHSAANTYIDTIAGGGVNGCDSIVTTILSLYAPDTFSQSQGPLCYGQTYSINGHTYSATGVYSDTIAGGGIHGCDSVITTSLSVYSLDTISQTQILCFGGSYTINGHTYSTSNTYIDTLAAADGHGCDSIVTTFLTIYPLDTFIQNIALCRGGSYTAGGITYDSSGLYINTLSGADRHGCDSTIILTLTIYSAMADTITASICAGDSFVFGSTAYYATGTYTDTLAGASAGGCDSIVTLRLTRYNNATHTITKTICQGSTYTAGGQVYDSTGSYIDTLAGASIHGCDSIVALHLTVDSVVVPSVTIYSTNTGDTICFNTMANLLAVGVNGGNNPDYQWARNGVNVGNSGTYVANTILNGDVYTCVITSTATCAIPQKDTSNAIIFVVNPYPAVTIGLTGANTNCSGDSVGLTASGGTQYLWSNGDTIPAIFATAGSYTVTATSNYGCTASSIPYVVTPNTPAADSLAQTGDTLYLTEGSGQFYQWTYNNNIIPGAIGSSYVATQSGAYQISVIDSFGCLTSSQTVYIVEAGISTIANITAGIYPNPNTGAFTLTLSDNAPHMVSITDELGRVIISGQIVTHIQQFDMAGVSNGIYYLQIANGNATNTIKFSVMK